MSDEVPEVLLGAHLKALKLPTFLREHHKLARQCAAEGVDHVRYLARLVELELIDRERRMVERRIKAARFPAIKSLDSFDFAAIPKLNKMLVLELARCEWIERRENAIALGPSGTGKTHVALGLGLAACQNGLSVGFTTAAADMKDRALREARVEAERMLEATRTALAADGVGTFKGAHIVRMQKVVVNFFSVIPHDCLPLRSISLNLLFPARCAFAEMSVCEHQVLSRIPALSSVLHADSGVLCSGSALGKFLPQGAERLLLC